MNPLIPLIIPLNRQPNIVDVRKERKSREETQGKANDLLEHERGPFDDFRPSPSSRNLPVGIGRWSRRL
jgi:hypothetical protein